MINPIEALDISAWPSEAAASAAGHAIASLEAGKVLLLPNLGFLIADGEAELISPACADGKSKNISFDPGSGVVHGCALGGVRLDTLRSMIGRFHQQTRLLVDMLLPDYRMQLITGLTSFRPLEVEGRRTSINKDDSRLHVDAFASRPNKGLRILRVFSNINLEGKPRVWEVGEPFESIAQRFHRRVSPQWPGSAWLLETARITKGRRSKYDHFMLGLHDGMKHDSDYQAGALRTRIEFPAGSTWICFSDCVAHAVLRGQHLLEQTFYLPVAAMHDQRYAPLRFLERIYQQPLA